MRPQAFRAIIDQETFDEAQGILLNQTSHKTDEQLLEELRALLAAEGRLSRQIIERSYAVSSLSTYVHRFGSLQRAYELAGGRTGYAALDVRQRTRGLRDQLMTNLASMFPNEISVVRDGPRFRTHLLLRDGLIVSVLASRAARRQCEIRWIVDPVPRESQFITLLIRLTPSNDEIQEMYIFPAIDKAFRFTLTYQDKWLAHGTKLPSLAEFCEMVQCVRAQIPAE